MPIVPVKIFILFTFKHTSYKMKILKGLLILLLILVVAGFIAVKYFSEDKPQGKDGAEADALANSMMIALNKPAFDSIPLLGFTFFRGKNHYLWDKKRERAIISWGENKVVIDLKSQEFASFVNDSKVEGDAAQKLKDKAWAIWCNDSFWLMAPYKVFDPGTKRSVVQTEGGKTGLLIDYSSGGVTPGDSYLWILDENNRPTAWKMWTSIIPVKGIGSTWEDWTDINGAIISLKHKIAGKEAKLQNVKAGNSYKDFGYDTDPFVI